MPLPLPPPFTFRNMYGWSVCLCVFCCIVFLLLLCAQLNSNYSRNVFDYAVCVFCSLVAVCELLFMTPASMLRRNRFVYSTYHTCIDIVYMDYVYHAVSCCCAGRAGLYPAAMKRVEVVLWRKTIFLCDQNSLCACARDVNKTYSNIARAREPIISHLSSSF